MVAMATGVHRCRPCGANRKSRPAKGFTLMEVMVALSVVAIALTAIYRMHTQTLFMDARGRFDTVAALLMAQQLADMDAIASKDITAESGDFGEDYPGYAWRIETEAVSSDLLKEDGPGLKRITLTISANEEESIVSLTTYRLSYE